MRYQPKKEFYRCILHLTTSPDQGFTEAQSPDPEEFIWYCIGKTWEITRGYSIPNDQGSREIILSSVSVDVFECKFFARRPWNERTLYMSCLLFLCLLSNCLKYCNFLWKICTRGYRHLTSSKSIDPHPPLFCFNQSLLHISEEVHGKFTSMWQQIELMSARLRKYTFQISTIFLGYWGQWLRMRISDVQEDNKTAYYEITNLNSHHYTRLLGMAIIMLITIFSQLMYRRYQ
jgi:hypothetical protein